MRRTRSCRAEGGSQEGCLGLCGIQQIRQPFSQVIDRSLAWQPKEFGCSHLVPCDPLLGVQALQQNSQTRSIFAHGEAPDRLIAHLAERIARRFRRASRISLESRVPSRPEPSSANADPNPKVAQFRTSSFVSCISSISVEWFEAVRSQTHRKPQPTSLRSPGNTSFPISALVARVPFK